MSESAKNVMVILAAVLVGAVIGIAAALIIGASNSADQANTKATHADSIAVAIAKERRESLRSFCEATNATHRNTIRSLDQILAAAERRVNASRRRAIAASRAPTVLLINALAPQRDCNTYVHAETNHP